MKSDKSIINELTEMNISTINMRTKITRNNELSDLRETIGQEITSFQKNNGAIGLHQSALIIGNNSKTASQEILEECSDGLKKYAPGWTIRTLTKTNWNGPSAIFNLVSKSTIVKAFSQTGLINVPLFKSKLSGLSVFLLLTILVIASLVVSGHWTGASMLPMIITFFFVIFAGFGVYQIVNNRIISKFLIPVSAFEALKLKKNRDSFKNCFSLIANNVCELLPLALIIEDLSSLDHLSLSVLKEIITVNQINSTGAVLWIIFNNNADDAEDIFSSSNFSVKRYTIKDEAQ